MADRQSRKWQITINNPAEKNLDHTAIRKILEQFVSCTYWAMADEIGLDTHTPHTHIFMVLKSPTKFSTIKRRFPEAHIESARGSCEDNRTYVLKSGKWANDPKADTSVKDSFEESGPLPEEPGQGARTDVSDLYSKIENGMSNAEVMAENPDSAKYIHLMDKIRQEILEARYREQWRNLDVTYIFGPTGTGKTRGVMEAHGYSNVYRVTDYSHPYDSYKQEAVILFEEFRSSLPIGDMLNYLDGYPLALPARYANRQACYETVYIISNIDLSEQYMGVQNEAEATWKAFLRRIHHVIEYSKDGEPVDHGNATDYIFPPPPPIPDWIKEAEETEQGELPFF